jgi:hypothetical protein
MLKTVMTMMSENQSSQSQVHVTEFGVLRVKQQKASFNRRSIAYTVGEGCSVLTNTNHVIWKQTVNATLAMGHQADPTQCYKFNILDFLGVNTPNFTIIILGLGKMTNSQDPFPAIQSLQDH